MTEAGIQRQTDGETETGKEAKKQRQRETQKIEDKETESEKQIKESRQRQ